MWWVMAAALADPYAVVPYQEGEVDHARPGLGRALAAMAVTDLHAAGIELVERSRVDAVLDELALVSSTFVDPAHAARLGRGLSARGLVLGTYSIAEGELILDLRVVDTETSAVVATSRSSGPLPRFARVGQSATTELARALGGSGSVAPAPTHDLDAFEAWARGLEAEQRGAIEEARVAYGRALDRDAGFSDAAEALVRAREALAASRAEQVGSTAARRRAQARRVVDGTRAIADSAVAETDVIVTLAHRWTALQDLGLDCQRQQEMLAFLDRHGWVLPALSPDEVHRTREALAARWKLERDATPAWGPPAARVASWQARMALFDDLPTFFSASSRVGVLASVNACLLPREELALLARLAKVAKGMPGVGGLDLGTMLHLQRLGRQAWLLGPDEAWEGEMARLELKVRPGHPGYELHQRMRERILRYAEDHAKMTRIRGPFSETELVGLARAGLPARDGAVCEVARQRWEAQAATALTAYDTLAVHADGREQGVLDPLATQARAAALFGCVAGHPQRVDGAAALQGLVLASLENPGDGDAIACGRDRNVLRQAATPPAEPTASALLETPAAQLDLGVQLYDAVGRGCIRSL